MSRLTQGVILLLFGGAILRASLTDLYLRYVKEGLRPFLIAAGLVLITAAITTIWESFRADTTTPNPTDEAAPTPPTSTDRDAPTSPTSADRDAPTSPTSADRDAPTSFAASPELSAQRLPSTDRDAPPSPASGRASAALVAPDPADMPLAAVGGHDHEHGDGHDHEHRPLVAWLLILPVLGLLLVAPPALGSFAAGQAGSVTAAPASDSVYPPLPPGDPAPISLLDYASRALFDNGRSLAGRDLKLIGFISPGPDGQPMLARIVMSCCAADGRPIKVGMSGRAPIDVPADTWVEVTAAYSSQITKDPVNDVDVAFIEVKTWQEVPQPKQPYV